jgi:hypothetical protein
MALIIIGNIVAIFIGGLLGVILVEGVISIKRQLWP